MNDSNNNSALSNHCLCLCDDDNDIEMALACLHAYIPSISSSSMEQTMHDNLTKFTVTSSSLSSSQDNNDNHESHEGIMDHLYATEEALRLVLERIKRHSQNDSQ